MLTTDQGRSPTFHNYSRIIDKTVHHTQGLCDSHPGLILRQSVQPLENDLDFALPQQFLRKRL
jgi:hypothetical protein